MKRRPSTRRAIAELLALWLGTAVALAIVFCIYHLASDEPSPIRPASFRKLT